MFSLTGRKEIISFTLVPFPFLGFWVLVLNINVMIHSRFQNFTKILVFILGISSSLENYLINLKRLIKIGFDPEVFIIFAICSTDVSTSVAIKSWVGPVCIPL